MNSSRRTAIVVGALFIAGYVGVFTAEAISGSILSAPDYLSTVYPNRIRMIVAVLVELLELAASQGD